jgi:hypothetical protein
MTAVNALGPITFNDAGRQFEIPLSQLFFDDQGGIKADRWDNYSSAPVDGPFQLAVRAWLSYLVKAEVITPAARSEPAAAMVITAVSPGAAGNDIILAVSNVTETPAGSGTFVFGASVTETDVHKGLTQANLITRLGNAAGGGSEPGLVFVFGSASDLPEPGDYLMSGATAKVDIPKKNVPAATAFTLKAKASGADGILTKISITTSASDAFDLTATWTKDTGTTPVAPSALQALFQYEIAVTAAPGQTALAAPAAGTYKLTGGANPSGPVPATVLLPGRS